MQYVDPHGNSRLVGPTCISAEIPSAARRQPPQMRVHKFDDGNSITFSQLLPGASAALGLGRAVDHARDKEWDEASSTTPEDWTRAWGHSTTDGSGSGCASDCALLRIASSLTELRLEAQVVGEANNLRMTVNLDEDTKGRREKKEKLEGSFGESKPVLDPVCLREMSQKGDAVSRMKLQLLWHREIGKDSQVPEHLSKLKLWTDVHEKFVEAVERHLEAGAGHDMGVESITVCACTPGIRHELKLIYRPTGKF